MADTKPDDTSEFSVVVGGPLYQLLLRSGLLRPPMDLVQRRIAALIVMTWVPLLVLTLAEGQAFSGSQLPFIQNLQVQARLLIALPLLIVAEVLVHARLAPAVQLFLEKGLVRAADRSRFAEIVASTMRLRNSLGVELFLMAFVFTGGHYLWQERFAEHGDTWLAVQTAEGWRSSLAGRYYAWVSLPIFQFILLRWYFRLVLWTRFLWRVSRLDLDLAPAHPDRAGGLGFLALSTPAFAPLLVGQSVLVSAMIGDRILHQGARLEAFKMELGGAMLFALLQCLGPLIVFMPPLLAAKRRGLRAYSLLADRYVREFERKWLGDAPPAGEPLVGSADIQSLADLDGSIDIVREMRPVPFGKQLIITIAAITAVPLLPLALTVLPLDELIRRLLGVLF